ncbi:MAG: hypothetical protein PHF63_00435 [Herbinix sp.]|nr:hypothetical protein [Herbinix sp.]
MTNTVTSKFFIYDTDTTNLSFIQMSTDLKIQGIKNNKFFLKLYDVSLKGIDPYSKNLTTDQRHKIILECIRNPWYYFREVSRIPDEGGTSKRFLLSRANLAMIYLALYGIDNYSNIPRQLGKTQSILAVITWAYLFGTTNSEIMLSNKKFEDAKNNLKRVKSQIDVLPPYLQMKNAYNSETGKIEKNSDNIQSVANVINKNKIVTKPSATSVSAAEQIGRGSTQPIQYYDEVEFSSYIKTIVEAAGPAYGTASDNADKNNAIHCRFFSSTPGDLDSKEGKDGMEIIKTCCKWSEEFYDWDREKIKQYITFNSASRIVYIEYSYTQLGKDEEWFKKMCALLNNNKMKIKRELLLHRIHGNSQSPFEPEDLDALNELKGKVIEEFFVNTFFLFRLYEKLNRSRVYFVGVDVSNGYGIDNTAVTIWDPYTRKVVGEFKSPFISVRQAADLLRTLVKNHIPRAILCIERNANGEGVLDLLRSSPIAHNLYWDNSKSVGDNIDLKMENGFIKQQAAMRKLYGVWTGTSTRPLMIDLLFSYVHDYKDLIIGNNIIEDINALVKKNDKVQAATGEHDDAVMSYLMCLYVYYNGNNLSRFGFVRGEIPDEADQNKGLTYDEVINYLPEETREVFKEVSNQSDSDYIAKIQEEINRARAEYNYMGGPYSDKNSDVYDYGAADLSLFDDLNEL